MDLVIDVNVLFSFFRKGRVFKLIEELTKRDIRLLIPTEMKEELLRLKHKIIKFAGISEEEWEELSTVLFLLVKSVSISVYKRFLEEAKKISPHKKDAPLFALSLAFNKAPIWSREPRLKRQKVIEVLLDKEVEEKFLK